MNSGASTQDGPFAQWCIVELLGHRRHYGYVTECTVAGYGFLRIDEPAVKDMPARSVIVSPTAVYALNPCGQDVAVALAAQGRDTPLSIWDLPEEWQTAIQEAKNTTGSRPVETVDAFGDTFDANAVWGEAAPHG